MKLNDTVYKGHLFLIVLYILTAPFGMLTIPGLGSAMKMFSIFIVLAGIVLLIYEDAAIKFNNSLAWAWSLYAIYTAFSSLWSKDFETSLYTGAGMVQVLILSLVVTKFELLEKDVRVIEGAWLIVSVICLLLFFGGAGHQYEYGGRSTIMFESGGADPNEFCAYFYMILAFLTVRILKKGLKPVSLICSAYMLAVFFCILLTGSRGGLLGAFVAISVPWLFYGSAPLKRLVVLCIALLTFYLIFTYFIVSLLPVEIIERLRPDSIIADGGSERTAIWQEAFTDIFSGTMRLIYGYGPFGVTFMRSAMHNQFIQALMDGGLIGLLLYIFFFVQLIKRAYRIDPAFLGGTAAAFTSLLTLTAYAFFKPVWVIFSMCLLSRAKEDVNEYQGFSVEGCGI